MVMLKVKAGEGAGLSAEAGAEIGAQAGSGLARSLGHDVLNHKVRDRNTRPM